MKSYSPKNKSSKRNDLFESKELNDYKFEKIFTKFNKEGYIENKEFIYYYDKTLKNNIKIFRCNQYKNKTFNERCKCTIKVSNDKIIERTGTHNHNKLEKNAIKLYLKNEINKKIENSENKFDFKIKNSYDNLKINIKSNNIPSFDSLKSSLYRKKNKELPDNVENFQEIDINSPYLKTKDEKEFCFYKNDECLIFMSETQINILFNNQKNIFIDATFFSAPKTTQLLIIRANDDYSKNYYTILFSIMKNKTEKLYKEIFNQMKLKINSYKEKYNINKSINIKTIHSDFEIGLINAARAAWPASKIKLCLFHFRQSIERKKKQYNNLLKNEIEVQQIFKQINTLPLIPIEYVEPVFTTIENENRFNELNSFFIYFRETYIKRFNPELWNYYNIANHRTNNVCEGYNNRINGFFSQKPTLWQLINHLSSPDIVHTRTFITTLSGGVDYVRRTQRVNILSNEEKIIKKNYEGDVEFGLKKIKYYDGGDYISCLPYFIENYESIKGNSEADKKEKLKIWLEATIKLPLN